MKDLSEKKIVALIRLGNLAKAYRMYPLADAIFSFLFSHLNNIIKLGGKVIWVTDDPFGKDLIKSKFDLAAIGLGVDDLSIPAPLLSSSVSIILYKQAKIEYRDGCSTPQCGVVTRKCHVDIIQRVLSLVGRKELLNAYSLGINRSSERYWCLDDLLDV